MKTPDDPMRALAIDTAARIGAAVAAHCGLPATGAASRMVAECAIEIVTAALDEALLIADARVEREQPSLARSCGPQTTMTANMTPRRLQNFIKPMTPEREG